MKEKARLVAFLATFLTIFLIVGCRHKSTLIKSTSTAADSLFVYHHRVSTEKKNEIKGRRELFVVKTIDIIVLKPAGVDILDTASHKDKWTVRAKNNLHTLTKKYTVKMLLLFKEGDTISPSSITESERLLRKFLKIRDARIIAAPVKGNSKDYSVTVIIQDLFAFNIGINSLNHVSTFSAADRNFMGYGSNLLGSVSLVKGKYSYYSLAFEDASVYNTYVDLSINYSTADSNVTKGIRLNKNFFTGLFTWAGGIGYAYKNTNRYIYNGAESEGTYVSKIRQTDGWVGKAITLSTGSKSNNFTIKNLLLSARFINTAENINGTTFFDTTSKWPVVNKTSNKALISVGYISRRYYKDSYIFRFKYSEDIPEGFFCSLTGGRSFNKYYADNYYAGITAGIANNNKAGYWNLTYQYVRSISAYKYFSSNIHSVKIFYLSPLLSNKRYKDRVIVNAKFQEIGNDFVYNRLYINNDDGFLNVNSSLLSGLIKASFNVTNIVYTPFKPLGFYVGFFAYAAVANIGSTGGVALTKNWYESVGIGVLLRNENLLINTIRIAFTYYPSFPDNTFKFNPLWIYELQIPEMSVNQPEYELN